jgi:hypothetical protein
MSIRLVYYFFANNTVLDIALDAALDTDLDAAPDITLT